jgi:RHS repeat-associated protein
VTTWCWQPETAIPVLKLERGARWWVETDHLGTPRALRDASGHAAWEASIDPWGRAEVHAGRARDCPWRWQGQWHDVDVGLYDNRHRAYDPALGAYLTPDPLGIVAGWNLHAYVRDPLTMVDPFGWMALFRALRPVEVPTAQTNGIDARNPSANATPMEHVVHGSDDLYPGDQFLSMTRDRGLAENWARRTPGSAVAVIDETRLPADGKLDLSTSAGRLEHLGDASRAAPGTDLHAANKMSRGASEVLQTGHIPADAITEVYTPAPRTPRTPPTDTSGDTGACH